MAATRHLWAARGISLIFRKNLNVFLISTDGRSCVRFGMAAFL